MAAVLCAAMFAVAGYGMAPEGNGTVRLPKSVVIGDDSEISTSYNFTNDEKGRIVKCTRTDFSGSKTFLFKYGDNTIKIVDGDDGELMRDITVKDGLAVCRYDRCEITYKYDESGYLDEIIENSSFSYSDKRVKTKFEWEDGCLKSLYEEEYEDNSLTCVSKAKILYGKRLATVGNYNPLSDIITNIGCWQEFGMMFNLLCKQSKYLPVKIEYSYHYTDDEEEFRGSKRILCEFNNDRTVSNINVIDTEGETEYYYLKFTY